MAVSRRNIAQGIGATLAAGIFASTWRAYAANTVPADLSGRFAGLEARSGGRIGVCLLDTGSGVRIGHRIGERFPMCSTFKVLACAALLARVDAGTDDMERRIRIEAGDVLSYAPVTRKHVDDAGMTLRELCAAAVTVSDNTAANLILAAIGGPAAVTDFVRTIGDAVTRLDRNEGSLNEATPGDLRDTTTPEAIAATLQRLIIGTGLSDGSRSELSGWMVGNQTGDAKLRAGLPKAWKVGDKTGSGNHGTTNDVAVIWPPGRAPVIVSAYMTQTTATPEQCNAIFAEIGQAAADFATQ